MQMLDKHTIIGDERGRLVVLESHKQVPFDIKRVFYIFGTDATLPRGKHAHYQTKQYLVAVNGSCNVTLDNGSDSQTYELNSPEKGLFQDAMIWGTMHDFSDDCVLLVLADSYYDEADYIRTYQEFLSKVRV